ncbi:MULTISPECIES: FMN-binding negative transcriptional regulator [Nitrospirillum]|uniref:PaiB family negative transcriptional regulator n=1 Tax=Nitrospirillum amazonense TaxID=28077 RepID=A0A560G1G5_9PROT|nr:FMN-binding negative transcriptional regulator [Nitrospirillum amazonense]MEC4589526.1 FMN-binding negative transcriptional regulator [Nitrospirillum amazonense]TWB27661.1 PaiB family negative transcriptional regulator [Nitrospirillum amazonense]
MYRPTHFKEDRLPVLHQAMAAIGLANLVTVGADGAPQASPLPLLLRADEGPYGTLYGHVARANPQWRETPAGSPALAIFMGPDAYISPSWYATKAETGKVVPTWNYATIHARGPITFFEDADALLDLVGGLTDRHEGARTAPWTVADAPADFIQAQLRGIIGFRLMLTSVEGKWKMSQNRPVADRDGIANGLARDGAAGVAALVRAGGAAVP